MAAEAIRIHIHIIRAVIRIIQAVATGAVTAEGLPDLHTGLRITIPAAVIVAAPAVADAQDVFHPLSLL